MTLSEAYRAANECVRETLRVANEARLESMKGGPKGGPEQEAYSDLAHRLTMGALAIQRDLGRWKLNHGKGA